MAVFFRKKRDTPFAAVTSTTAVFLIQNVFCLDISDFDEHAQEYIRVINECYKCSEHTEEIRKLTFLDPLRSLDYPADIQVLLRQKGIQIEQVWVKCFAYTEDELFGNLLNEPAKISVFITVA